MILRILGALVLGYLIWLWPVWTVATMLIVCGLGTALMMFLVLRAKR